MVCKARLSWRSPPRSGPVAGHLPGGGGDRVDPGQGGEGGLGAEASGMRPADQHLGGAQAARRRGPPAAKGPLLGPGWSARPATGRPRRPAAGYAPAVARSARTVARCSSDLVGRSRRLAQQATWRLVGWPRSSARSSSGAPTISALSSPDGGHPGQRGAAACGQQHAQRLPLPPTPRGRQLILAERLAGGCGPRPTRRSWRRCDWLAVWAGSPPRPARRIAATPPSGRRRSCPLLPPPTGDGREPVDFPPEAGHLR